MALFRHETREGANLSFDQSAALAKIVLRGRIVSMNKDFDVIDDGVVCIEADKIKYVGRADKPLPPDFNGTGIIETHGTIYPGLVELHNHPAYNAIPMWEVPTKFSDRYVWRGNDNYKRRVAIPASLLTHHPQDVYPKSVARFAECRALLGGVTTTQGLTIKSLGGAIEYYKGLVRNVEFPLRNHWPVAEDYVNDFKTPAEAAKNYGPHANNPKVRYINHICEGTDDASRAYLLNLKTPEGNWLPKSNFIGVHATALLANQFDALQHSAGIVWSPLSNLLLYGETTAIRAAVSAKIPVCIGSDWAPSGTKNLLGELKIAKAYSDHHQGLFTDRQLVSMATQVPAKMMAWESYIGSIEAGKIADLLVIDSNRKDPYEQLIYATEQNVIAVVIDGRPRAGRANVLDPRTNGVELIRVANQDMVLDVIEDAGHPLAGIKLSSAISTLKDALLNLPDLAESAPAQFKLMDGKPDSFVLHLDFDENLASALASGEKTIGRGDVDSMELEPITAVDDVAFVDRIKANINIPDWLRNAL